MVTQGGSCLVNVLTDSQITSSLTRAEKHYTLVTSRVKSTWSVLALRRPATSSQDVIGVLL